MQAQTITVDPLTIAEALLTVACLEDVAHRGAAELLDSDLDLRAAVYSPYTADHCEEFSRLEQAIEAKELAERLRCEGADETQDEGVFGVCTASEKPICLHSYCLCSWIQWGTEKCVIEEIS